jgi:hypothetical protein
MTMTEHMDRIGVLLVNSPDVPTDMSDVADGAAIVATVQRALNTLNSVRNHNVDLLARMAEYDIAHDRMVKALSNCPAPFESLGAPDEVAAAVELAITEWRETELALCKRAAQCDELRRENTKLEAENLRLARELADTRAAHNAFENSANTYKARHERECIRVEALFDALRTVVEAVRRD